MQRAHTNVLRAIKCTLPCTTNHISCYCSNRQSISFQFPETEESKHDDSICFDFLRALPQRKSRTQTVQTLHIVVSQGHHVTATMPSSLGTRSAVSTKLIRETVLAPSKCGVTCRPTVEDGPCSRGGLTDRWISIVVGTIINGPGFGDLHGEFWLGLEKIHRLTTSQVLRIDLADFANVRRYAHYDSFTVGPLSSSYIAYLGNYSGTAGDSFWYHNGMKFTTKDKDNDNHAKNCAVVFKGAWWYKQCHEANLNGLYLKGPHTSPSDGVNWLLFRNNYSLKLSEMKIRSQ